MNILSRFKPKPAPTTRLGRYLRPSPWWVAPLGIATAVVGALTFKTLRDLARSRKDELAGSAPSGDDPANTGDRPDDATPPVA